MICQLAFANVLSNFCISKSFESTHGITLKHKLKVKINKTNENGGTTVTFGLSKPILSIEEPPPPPGQSVQPRPERWIVTIPLSDQWLATIGNHWKTIATNGFGDQKPLKNHC